MDKQNTDSHQADPKNSRKNSFQPLAFIVKTFKKIAGKKKHPHHRRNENREILRESRRLNKLTFFLVIANVILAIGTISTALIMDSSSYNDLRAYVAVNRVDTLHYKLPKEMAKISIVNYGKTPARKVVIDYIFEFLGRDT